MSDAQELQNRLLKHSAWLQAGASTEDTAGRMDLSDGSFVGDLPPGTSLRLARLTRAELTGLNLPDLDMSEAELEQAVLLDVYLPGVNLTGSRGEGSSWIEAHMEAAHMEGADLLGADFSGANLGDSCARGADFTEANLEKASLFRADLRDVSLRRARLAGADMTEAMLVGADLTGADLENADLRGATALVEELSAADNLQGCRLSPSLLLSPPRVEWIRQLLAKGAALDAELVAELFELEGLTLHFDQRLTRVDRALVEGVIAVIGPSGCEIAAFEVKRYSTIVRLEGVEPAVLEAVAEQLWSHAWSELQQTQQAQAFALAQQLNAPLVEQLSQLQQRLVGMELRLADSQSSPSVREALERWAGVENTKAIQEQLEQHKHVWARLGRRVGKAVLTKAWGKVGDEILDAASEEVKGLGANADVDGSDSRA